MEEPAHELTEIPDEDPVDRALRAIKDISLKWRSVSSSAHTGPVNILGTTTERIVRDSSERERAVQGIVLFLDSIGDPKRLAARRRAIEKKNPLLERHQRLAEWQMFLADHLYSNPIRFSGTVGQKRLGALDTILTKSKLNIAGRQFDLTGIKGLAGAISIIGANKYVPFYPDPMLDVLLKIDALGYDENADHHLLVQVKTRRGLTPPRPIIDTPWAFFERDDVRKNFDTERISRLVDDALVLELAAEAMRKKYSGRFTPLLMVMPAFRPGETDPDFNTQTGLPKREALGKIRWPGNL